MILRNKVMGQVTIYLEREIENKMIMMAESSQLSKSKWIAKLIEEKIATKWPQSITDCVGSWDNFPTIDEIRSNTGKDTERKSI